MGNTLTIPETILNQSPLLRDKRMRQPVSDICLDENRRIAYGDMVYLAKKIYGAKSATRDVVCSASQWGTLAAWSKTKGVYAFDATFSDELANTTMSQELRPELLNHLPEPCVWIEPGKPLATNEGEIVGFFISITDTDGVLMLPAHRTDRNESYLLGIMNMTLGHTIEACLRRAKEDNDGIAENVDALGDHVARMVSMALYLCTEEPDIITTNESRLNRQRLRQGKTPFHPTVHHVGYRYGAAFCKAKEERAASEGAGGTGRSPTPHIRRAHWHTYWKGARGTEERHQVVKWLPPIPVNLKSYDDLVPTIRKVKR